MNPFELTMTLPGDERFAETLRAVAMQAAQQAGCADAKAAQFGADVESALCGCAATSRSPVAVVFRMFDSALEAVLTMTETSRVARTIRIDV